MWVLERAHRFTRSLIFGEDAATATQQDDGGDGDLDIAAEGLGARAQRGGVGADPVEGRGRRAHNDDDGDQVDEDATPAASSPGTRRRREEEQHDDGLTAVIKDKKGVDDSMRIPPAPPPLPPPPTPPAVTSTPGGSTLPPVLAGLQRTLVDSTPRPAINPERELEQKHSCVIGRRQKRGFPGPYKVHDDDEVHENEVHDSEVHDSEVHDSEVHDSEVHENEVHDNEVHSDAVHENDEVHSDVVHYHTVHDDEVPVDDLVLQAEGISRGDPARPSRSRVSALRQILLAQAPNPFALRAGMATSMLTARDKDTEEKDEKEPLLARASNSVPLEQDGSRHEHGLIGGQVQGQPATGTGTLGAAPADHQLAIPRLIEDLKVALALGEKAHAKQGAAGAASEPSMLASPCATKPLRPPCDMHAHSPFPDDAGTPGLLGLAGPAGDSSSAAVSDGASNDAAAVRNEDDDDGGHGGEAEATRRKGSAAARRADQDTCLECCVYSGVLCCRCTIM